MRIVIAPDKFKGSLSAPDVCGHLEKRLQLASGGNGFTRSTAIVSGPTGQPVEADFAIRGHEAVIEMATASGLALVPQVQHGGQPDSASATMAEQSLLGKTPMGVARAAAADGVPVIAVCGRTTLARGQLVEAGFEDVYALTELESNVDRCIAEAAGLLEQLGTQIGGRIAAARLHGPPGTREDLHV
jgi:glycerate kinase